MMLFRKSRLAVLSAVAAALLAACGGGSEDAQEPQSASLASDSDSLGSPMSATLTATRVIDPDGKNVARSVRSTRSNGVWIVQLAEPPASSYTGGINNMAATKPGPGKKINRRSPAVQNYTAFLKARHDAVLAAVGGGKKVYDYSLVYNGFAAKLTDAQAEKLKAVKGVRAVVRDQLMHTNTATTPAFLGLSGSTGVWNTTGAKGEDIVIGVIDSGLWPESNSFADKVDGNGKPDHGGTTTVYNPPANWNGTCATGTQWTSANCNNKMIGARWFNEGWGGDAGITSLFPYEYLSARDWGGHGSHTSSTAGGNANVTVTGPAAGMGSISGIAPRARIAMYKICWSTTELDGGCFATDAQAAIEAAIEDGVDVINFSVGSTQDTYLYPTEYAFLEAAANGVFVATSAGNDGPDPSTVEHPSPWTTTVAAGTIPRSGTGSVTINSSTFAGASFAVAVSAPIIKASDAGMPGADPDKVRFCYADIDNGNVAVLDPTKVDGKIVLCERGSTATVAANARVNKSLAVADAGGVGMVLVNIAANSTNADIHAVPTVHLPVAMHDAVFAAATGGPTASIAQATLVNNVPAPLMASFSSRGPGLGAGGNLLKPDIVAPGQDILAAVAPPGNSGKSFDLYSGTSMASPHIAGIAALFKQIHPTWSPMMIKSALMTTAYDVLDGSTSSPDVAFAQGAGHVNPQRALDPGLVFDSNIYDWAGFLCAVGEPLVDCGLYGIPVVQPSNLNVPSIALAGLAGTETVTRRVTNVSSKRGIYTAKRTGLVGIGVTMSPSRLMLAPGQTQTVTFKFVRTNAAMQTYSSGQITLSDGTHNVRVPVVAQPVALQAPTEVSGSYTVKFGQSTGLLKAVPRGLVPAMVSSSTVAQSAVREIQVEVPPGTTYVRFATFDSQINVPDTDLDLEVVYDGHTVGGSGGFTAEEQVSFVNPPAGIYTVKVTGYFTPGGSSSFNLYSWALGSTAAGNMTVKLPTRIVAAQTGTVTITTSNLTPGTKYLGSVAYTGLPSLPAPTIVRIDAGGAL